MRLTTDGDAPIARITSNEFAAALAADSGDAARGIEVGPYRLESRTRLSLAVDYAARHAHTDRAAVLRFIDLSLDTRSQYRAFEEARALARLDSNHVIAVFEAGDYAGLTWVASEPPRGVRLDYWLAHEHPRPEQVLAVLADAGRGLAAAHQAGALHRGIGPKHIYVHDNAGAVAGFSIDDAPGAINRSRSWSLCVAERGLRGDPAFLAPEQLDGFPATAHSDQYALAVVAYLALHGEHPFGSASDLPGLYRAVKHDRFPVTRTPAGVPRHVMRAIARALAVDPSHRFESMAEFADQLALSGRTRWLGLF